MNDEEIRATVNAAFARFEEQIFMAVVSSALTPQMQDAVLKTLGNVREDLTANPENYAQIIKAVREPES